jgi:ribosomal protein S27AE
MNPKVSARLAFVCLGVLALMDSVLLLGGLFSTLSIAPRGDYNKPLMIVAAVVPFFMMAALGIYLILRSTRLAMKHFSETPQTEGGIPATDLQRLTFVCLGVFIVISAIPSIGSFVALLTFLNNPEAVTFYTKLRLGEYVGRLIQLAVGIYLIVSVSGWRLFKRAAPDKVTVTVSEAVCPNCGHPFHPQDYNYEAKEKTCSACGHSLPETLFENT